MPIYLRNDDASRFAKKKGQFDYLQHKLHFNNREGTRVLFVTTDCLVSSNIWMGTMYRSFVSYLHTRRCVIICHFWNTLTEHYTLKIRDNENGKHRGVFVVFDFCEGETRTNARYPSRVWKLIFSKPATVDRCFINTCQPRPQRVPTFLGQRVSRATTPRLQNKRGA